MIKIVGDDTVANRSTRHDELVEKMRQYNRARCREQAGDLSPAEHDDPLKSLWHAIRDWFAQTPPPNVAEALRQELLDAQAALDASRQELRIAQAALKMANQEIAALKAQVASLGPTSAQPQEAPGNEGLRRAEIMQLIKVCHPDKWGNHKVANELTKELNALYKQRGTTK
jgi:hypothetical protein